MVYNKEIVSSVANNFHFGHVSGTVYGYLYSSSSVSSFMIASTKDKDNKSCIPINDRIAALRVLFQIQN